MSQSKPSCAGGCGIVFEEGDGLGEGDTCPSCRTSDLADVDLEEYRGRGRPRLAPELRRREKLVISLNQDELRRIMVRAAKDRPAPLSPHDWARKTLLEHAPPIDPEEKP